MADETKIIRIVIDSSKAVDGSAAATRALQNIEKATGDAANSMTKIEAALGRVGGYLKAHLAIIIGEMAAKLIEMGKAALEAVGGLDELAEQLGITANGLQALQFSAVQNGLKLEQLEVGVTKFSQKMGEASKGNKEVIESLNDLGVKILDINGNLRPTETLMSEVAQAILKIDDPAKRTAASIDFFSKSGAKFQPVLQDLARGFEYMGQQAQQAGAMVDDHVRKRLDELGDASERNKLKIRAFLAETAVAVLDAADKAKEAMKRNQEASKDGELAFRNWMDSAIANMAGVAAGIVQVFSGAVDQIIKMWIDGFNSVLTAAEQWANKMGTVKMPSVLGGREVQLMDPVNLGRISGGGASASDYLQGINNAATTTRDNVQAYYARQRAAQERARYGGQGYGGSEPPPGSVTIAPGGAGNPPPKGGGGGDDPEKKYQRLEQQLLNTKSAQDAMTMAARAGDRAFEDQKAELDAQNKLLEIYGSKLAIPADRLKTISDLNKDIARGKVAEAFNVATTELQKQNVILEAQIRLMNETPEIQARELALIKSKQEAEKAGNALSAEDVENRRAAIETNERLKAQQEELKKAQELWTEPLKQALRDIQSTAADAFEGMLESGKISFESLRDTFIKIIRRMAAEFLALATIRPVMSVLVNAVSPAFAQSMGLGSAFPGMGGGSSGGGMLGGGGMLSGVGSWLGSPISPGSMPDGMFGPALPGLGGLTWGQGIAGAAGIGAGIYGLLTSKTPSGMVGSGLGVIGSGIGLASAAGLLPMLGAAGGPIGMGIGLLGGILASTGLLDGLFGSQNPTITNQTYGQLSYGSGGWYTTGGAWGPSANSSATQQGLAGLGGGISSVFSLLGGVKDPSKVWGLSASNKTVSGKDWSSSSDSTFLVDPSGNQTLWRMNEANMMDTGAEQVARASILGGAVGDITENMRKAVQSIGETTSATLQELASAISEIQAFDKAIAGLGKTTTSAEQAIAQIDQQFASLYDTASKYGLATGDLDTAKAKARLDYATGFGSDINKQILQITDPKAAAMADIDDWQKMMEENNKWLLDNVQGTQDHLADIERLGGLKRAQIAEQATNQALTGIKDVITRLTYGDLSGASPTATLGGLQGAYSAMLAQANAGNATAVAGIGGAAASLAQFAGSYYGTATPQYQALVGGLRNDLSSVYVAQGGSASDLSSLLTGFATISAQFAANEEGNAALKEDMATLTTTIGTAVDLMTRIAAKIAA